MAEPHVTTIHSAAETTTVHPVRAPRGVGRGLRLSAVWLYWFFAAAYCVIAAWEMIPINYKTTANEWSVQNAYWGISGWLTYVQWVRLAIGIELLTFTVMVATALLIVWLRPRDWVAVVISATLLLLSIVLGIHGNQDSLQWPGWLLPWRGQINALVITGFMAGIFTLLLLFPNGRLAPGWAGRIGAATVGLMLAYTLTGLITPLWSVELHPVIVLLYPLLFFLWLMRTPGRRPVDWLMRVLATLLLALVAAAAMGLVGPVPQGDTWSTLMSLLLVGITAGLVSQWQRYRSHSSPRERQQTRWVVIGLTVALGGLLLSIPFLVLLDMNRLPALLSTAWSLAQSLAVLALPLSLALALLRDGLWEVESAISRALVYVALTGVVLVSYVLAVGALSLLLGRQQSMWVAIAATGLAALAVHPLRVRLQAAVNRLIYGERDDPVTVLQRLGHRLEATLDPEAALHALTETVGRSLKLPYVALEQRDGELAAVWGTAHPQSGLEAFPLVFQGEALGRLVVGGRAPGEKLSAADRRLLENVTLQAGPAMHAQQLARQLQQSRQALVLAREEERRRLRRDLHDGLGPLLASQALTLDAVGRRLASDPAQAAALVQNLKQQTQEAVRDIRRMVYDLRPPALDDLGLVEALRQLSQQSALAGPEVTLETEPNLPPLPAAVEVAAWRIAQEALTNAVRHAQATTISLRLAHTGHSLTVEVKDDGVGLREGATPGVGIRSMRERAAELGGDLRLESLAGGGLSVVATLPVE